jgi:hypothetical protein
MAGERTFVVKFVSDTKDAIKGVTQMNNAFARFSSNVEGRAVAALKGLIPSFKQVAIAGVAGLGAAATASFKLAQMASDLQEAQSKVNAVFGASGREIEEFAKTTATSMGITRQATLETAGTLGNLVQAFGISKDQAADMSQRLIVLAADLSSFNNVPIDQVFEALRSGLTGETEPLKKFGVAINDVRLKQEAMNMGLYDGKGALDITAKTQAAYALILKDTALAQGDVERTSGGFANQMRFLKAGLQDAATELGTYLLPYFERFVTFVNKYIVPAIKVFVENVGDKGVKGAFDLAIASMGDFSTTFVGGMKSAYVAVLTVVKEMATFVRQIAFVGGVASALGRNVGGYFKALGFVIASENIEKRVADALGNADQLFDNLAISVSNARNELFLMGRPTKDTSDAFERAGVKGSMFAKSVQDVKNQIDPSGGGGGGGGGVKKALQTAADKMKDYSDAIKNATDAQKSFTRAQRDTASANKSLTQANSDVISAQAKLDKAIAGYGENSDEAKKAQLELNSAQRGVIRAAFRVEESVFGVKKAEEELAKVRLDPESTPMAIREAELALAEAKLAVADANDDQIRAQFSLNDATDEYRIIVAGVNENDEIYKDLTKDLTDAKDRQEEATLRVKDAVEAEREALDKLKESIQNLQGAYAGAINIPGVTPFDPSLTQIPGQVVGGGGTGSNMNNNQVTVNVAAGWGADGRQIGKDIEEYLRQYATVSGGSFANGSIGNLFGR